MTPLSVSQTCYTDEGHPQLCCFLFSRPCAPYPLSSHILRRAHVEASMRHTERSKEGEMHRQRTEIHTSIQTGRTETYCSIPRQADIPSASTPPKHFSCPPRLPDDYNALKIRPNSVLIACNPCIDEGVGSRICTFTLQPKLFS